MRKIFAAFISVAWFCLSTGPAAAADIKVAVASNFKLTLQKLAVEFEQNTQHRVRLSSGSTGKHYAQILQGAPFDVFFAADSATPAMLLEQGFGQADTLQTYAHGRLALWHPASNSAEQVKAAIQQPYRHLAIANSRIAPYGRAAQQVHEHLGLELNPRTTVIGENIAQTFQFVASGNAELGYVAASQLMSTSIDTGQGIWLIPQDHHAPIKQQAVVLSRSPAAAEFLNFVLSEPAQQLIIGSGYTLP